ncbi:hypothetical protein TWF225_010852 [Orbilia oligospora]|uniref:Uncharacterized protein n=1 Tax=Orbilia oligospora TaxID=2813651 RepID=A0A8H2E889_ORBOL|nr:hypothetical protein TWF225_010852 [Orbilia oligospora]KAF3252517.1 hypothetical protein TWF217_007712 [Orbilia oligospora]KAF3271446.1 hypothetical protein TWF128_000042 [Orbilia oligospora]KAF3292643.1 hypothetical protein TWF132_005357 [Orbilia oligospora]TGJ72773.1 hypothetical protein EYR41_004643 [Orbilia oligospora]
MTPELEFSNSPDLILEFVQGAVKRRGFVSAAALADASSIWHSSLYIARLPTQVVDNRIFRVLVLGEDCDADALTTVLYILHHRARKVPRSISFQKLVNISMICKKYDLAEALLPWPEFWIEDLVQEDQNTGNEGWLLVSHVFGDIPDAQKQAAGIASKLAVECAGWTLKESTHFVRYSERHGQTSLSPNDMSVVRTDLIPSSILDEIWNTRKSKLLKIIPFLEGLYRDMSLHTEIYDCEKPRLCSNRVCVDVAVGSILRSTRELGLPLFTPFPPDTFISMPLWLLRNKLLALSCTTIIPWSRIDTAGLFKHLFKLPKDENYCHYQLQGGTTTTSEFSAIYLSNPSEELKITDSEDSEDARPKYDIGKSECGIATRMRGFQEQVRQNI